MARSHSTWVRELKSNPKTFGIVSEMSHSTWVRELKYAKKGNGESEKGRTPRECVSWNMLYVISVGKQFRRTPRECVSWNEMWYNYNSGRDECRTPRECVSWNRRSLVFFDFTHVALHVSAWVEMILGRSFDFAHTVALHVSAWVEIRTIGGKKWILCTSHSTWVRELKWTNAVPL